MPDPLTTLIRVRRLACEDAQRSLVAALSEESRAEAAVHAMETIIARETAAASDPDGSDAVVEAFAAWLPGARSKLETARQAHTGLQAETARVRAALTACRTALESVETLQQQRQDAARHAREKAEQRELEDRPPRAGLACPDGRAQESG